MECGIKKMRHQQLHEGDGDNPRFRENIDRGAQYSREYEQGEGEWYERWREGMQRYLKSSFTTSYNQASKVPGKKSARGRQKTGR